MKIQLCDVCRFDGGLHYADDGTWTRPHHEAGKAQASAEAERDAVLAAVAASNEQALEHLKQMIRDVALVRPEFSANAVHERMRIAQIPGSLAGPAFKACAKEGVIRHTGRFEMSDDKKTRHLLGIYTSLTYRADVRALAVS